MVRAIILTVLCLASLLSSTVAGQNYVTTTTQTSTTATRTYTMGSVITSLSQPQLIVNQSFTVFSTTGTSDNCEMTNFTFSSNRGEYVSGHFAATIPLDFYIMTDGDYQNLMTHRSCGSVPAVSGVQNAMNYSFNVALPDTGLWDIVLINRSDTRNASGFLKAELTLGNSVTSELSLITNIETVTFQATVTEQAGTGVSAYSLLIIVSMIAIVFAIVLFMSRKILKRQSTAKSSES